MRQRRPIHAWNAASILVLPAAVAMATATLAAGCSNLRAEEATCVAGQQAWSVRVTGSLSSSGRLTVQPSDNQAGVYDMALEIDGRPRGEARPEKPVIVVRGVGTCEHGVMRARFGGDAGENEQYKVVGGVVESLMIPEVIGQPFGAWNMNLFDKAKEQTVNFRGFWRAVPANSSSEPKAKASPSSSRAPG